MPDSVDSNILIYLALEDLAKKQRAGDLLYGGSGIIISVQVLNEVANVLRRKAGFGWDAIAGFIDRVRRRTDVRPLTIDIHSDGLRLARRYNFAIYDALIVAAALDAGSETLWSEDMQDGMVVDDRLTIRNPFAGVTL